MSSTDAHTSYLHTYSLYTYHIHTYTYTYMYTYSITHACTTIGFNTHKHLCYTNANHIYIYIYIYARRSGTPFIPDLCIHTPTRDCRFYRPLSSSIQSSMRIGSNNVRGWYLTVTFTTSVK